MKLYNTLSKQKETFSPLHAGKVGMYVCGPTVYDFVHIGNWRAYVFSDTLRRVLEHAGYELRHIENITDVGHLTQDDIAQGDSGEDKIVKKALAEKKTPFEIARFYTDYFHGGEKALNILPAHFYPRATAHIDHMIRMIETLIARGHAYEARGAVFYDVTSFFDYGKLSGNTLTNLEVGARLEAHPDKKNPWDFALWLPAPKEHLMEWQSPWSVGYPGWHIECSAMSQEYLGDVFDIHTGGEDHIFPHHEAEIAQTCGVTGNSKMATTFLHLRHMLVEGEKMSKSKNNFYTLEDVYKKGFDAMDLRLCFLQSHYRSQMNFTWEALEQAKKNKEKFFNLYRRFLTLTNEASRPGATTDIAGIAEALEDDLNTPLALAAALDLVSTYNQELDAGNTKNASLIIQNIQTIFGLFGLRYEKEVVPEEVVQLAKERQKAREIKDYARSDELRAEIKAAGFTVKDTETGFDITKI
jgi:cysteinyl-tRNA synthetase